MQAEHATNPISLITLSCRNLKFMLFDVGGQTSIRTSWTIYLQATNAVVFVVDTTDRARTGLARQELHRVAAEEVSAYMHPH